MSDPLVLSTLRKKREEITAAIKTYEKRLEQTKRDLGHVNAVIRVFEASGDPGEFPVHVSTRLMFKRGEIATFCKAALGAEGPLDTRDLARRLMRYKGLDKSDEPLRITITYRTTQALRFEAHRGGVKAAGMQKGVRLWALAPSAMVAGNEC